MSTIQTMDWQLETEEEFEDVGSFNHSMVQANLAHQFKLAGDYTVLTELTLDSSSLDHTQYNVKDEMIPDVCVYPKRPLILPFDVLKMTEMPPLVVEVLSSRQLPSSLIEKFAAYFAMGVKSCWLVDPLTQVVHVYKSLLELRTYTIDTVVKDDAIGIQFPVANLFE